MLQSGKAKQAFIAGCLAFMFFSTEAQSVKDHLSKGDRYYQRKDYENALENYLKVLEADANDAQTNFKTGISFLHEEDFSRAVIHLEKAYNVEPEVDPDIDYHLAGAYQQDHQYAKARLLFESFKARNKSLSAVANQKIMECIIGDSLMRNPVKVAIEPLGSGINTAFSELFPIITPEGNLIFTSDRGTEEYQIKSGSGSEDVYISERTGGQWARPRKISESINVKLNDAAVSLAPDGKTLFLNYEEGAGDIYTSTLENGQWTRPVALNRFINHPQYRESAASLSPDGKRLYFTSNRPGGKGGFDLYVCALGANGQWGRPSNLGSAVNTRQDEESPFLHADGVTLYFSSNGQATLGSHDIFQTTIANGKWSPPQNLGYPVNTSGYEGHFVLSADKKTGYLSSRRAAAASNLDIYEVIFSTLPSLTDGVSGANTVSGNTRPDKKAKMVTLLRGKVIDVGDTRPLEATLSLVDHSTKTTLTKITTGPSGDFELVIPRGGNYGVTTEKAGYLFNSMNFNLPEFEKYQEIDTHILMVKAQVGSKVVLKNVFFDLSQSALKAESLSELENIRDLLINNPQWRIQINGHTDNVGHPTTNQSLSLKRAQSVVQYLIDQGISAERLEAKGFGSERPLVSNDDETEGRQINRRTEIEIIK